MANKLQIISELSQSTIKELSNVERWTAFLRSAAWQYKYPFEDQVLIFAQRPDARACADFDTWNEKLNRRINRGAKGIALLRDGENGYFLDHVFDVSDTNRHIRGVDINLWKYTGKYDDAIIETLENTFGDLLVTTTLTDSIICAAHNAIVDSKADYLSDLKYLKEDSFLADLDELNLDVRFQKIAETSVAFIVMERMGLAPGDLLDEEEFQYIVDFNSPDTMATLGEAISSVAEQALREISATISAEIKKEREFFAKTENSQYNINTERDEKNIETEVEDNDRDYLQNGERNTDSELGSSDGDGADRQIRTDAPQVPETEQTTPLLSDDDKRNVDGTLGGDRQNSERASGTDDIENGSGGGRERELESEESEDVDRTYEQPQTFRRRGSSSTVSSQLSLFDLIDGASIQEDMQREAERLSSNRPAFSISQQIIDEVLVSGSNGTDNILKTCIEFSKNKSLESNAEYLKKEYRSGGKGFIFDDTHISAWWNHDGIRISRGKDTVIADTILSWEDASKRINELLELGRFAPQEILDRMSDYEITHAAQSFWYMHRDVNFDDYPELRDMFTSEWFDGGYPDSVERFKQMMTKTDELNKLIGITRVLAGVDKNHDDVMRWRSYSPEKILPLLEDMLIPRAAYKTDILSQESPQRFITDDELHFLVTSGFGHTERKYAIYRYFSEHPDTNERLEYLKTLFGKQTFNYMQYFVDSKKQNIELSRNDIMSPFAKVTIKLKDLEKQISQLIEIDAYLTKDESETLYPAWLEKTTDEERRRERRYEVDTYLRDFWRDKSTAHISNIPKRAQYLFEYCGEGFTENSVIKEHNVEFLIGGTEIDFAEAMKSVEIRTNLADCFYQLARSTGDVTIRNTGYMLSDELRNLQTITLHRVGDFYEMFGDEAKLAAEVLELQLTHREINGERTDMVMMLFRIFTLQLLSMILMTFPMRKIYQSLLILM